MKQVITNSGEFNYPWFRGNLSLPSVLWYCRSGYKKGIRPVKTYAGGGDLTGRLSPLAADDSTISCCSEIQNFWHSGTGLPTLYRKLDKKTNMLVLQKVYSIFTGAKLSERAYSWLGGWRWPAAAAPWRRWWHCICTRHCCRPASAGTRPDWTRCFR